MAKVVTLIPEVKVYSLDLDAFYPLVPIGDKKYSCAIVIPPNDDENPIEYQFEIYIGNKASGMVTTVTIEPEEVETVKTFVIDLNILPDLEGEILVSVNFSNMQQDIDDISESIGNSEDTAANNGSSVFSIIKWIANKFVNTWTDARAGNLDAAISTRAAQSNLGVTGDTGGTASAGTAMAKLNAILNSSSSSSGGTGARKAVFTANGTFTVPTGVTAIKILAFASGGDGGNPTTDKIAGVGGKAGESVDRVYTVTAGANISITVGAGNTVLSGAGLGTITLIKGNISIPSIYATNGLNGLQGQATPARNGGGGGIGGFGGGGGGGGAGGDIISGYSGGNGGDGGTGRGGGGGGGGGGGSGGNQTTNLITTGGIGYSGGGKGGSGTRFGGSSTNGTAGSLGGSLGSGMASTVSMAPGGGGGGGAISKGGNGGGNYTNSTGGGGGGGGGYGAGGGGGGAGTQTTGGTGGLGGAGGNGIVFFEW